MAKAKDETKGDAVAEAEAPAIERKPAPPIGEDRWQLKEHRNPGHWICVTVGTTLEDLQRPEYWANVARHIKPCTTVEVHWDDGSQFAELYVLDAGRNWVSADILRHKELSKPTLPHLATEFDIGFNGPVEKYRITRRSDRAVIKSGFATEADARAFLDDYKRKIAA